MVLDRAIEILNRVFGLDNVCRDATAVFDVDLVSETVVVRGDNSRSNFDFVFFITLSLGSFLGNGGGLFFNCLSNLLSLLYLRLLKHFLCFFLDDLLNRSFSLRLFINGSFFNGCFLSDFGFLLDSFLDSFLDCFLNSLLNYLGNFFNHFFGFFCNLLSRLLDRFFDYLLKKLGLLFDCFFSLECFFNLGGGFFSYFLSHFRLCFLNRFFNDLLSCLLDNLFSYLLNRFFNDFLDNLFGYILCVSVYRIELNGNNCI